MFRHAHTVAGGLLLWGCAPTVLPVPRLDVPDTVAVAGVPFGVVTTVRVPVDNVGTAEARVAISTDGPLVAPDRIDIPAGGRADVLVAITPMDPADTGGILRLQTRYEVLRVPVRVDLDPDADDDGALAPAAGGDDCDDFDPSRAPGRPETCDGRDEDCDGRIDEDPIDAAPFYRDADRDGWGDASEVRAACERPPGYVARPGDCDDRDPSIHPDAPERWYDGVDQDCDGASDYDADADGWDGLGHGGADCQDRDPRIHPDAPEIPSDGVDQDCDGFVDERPPSPGEVVFSELLPIGVAGPAYVELASVATGPVTLAAVALDTQDARHLLPDVVVPEGGFAVVCTDVHPVCDAVIPDLDLQDAETLTLGADLDVVHPDRLPHAAGVAAEATALDPVENDAPEAWCPGRLAGATGDLGTPGDPPSCP